MVATPRIKAISATIVTTSQAIILRIVIGPRVLLQHSVGRQWHTGVVHRQELLLVKVLLVLDIEPNIINILLRNRQFVLPLLVLRVVLHSLHLVVVAWLVLITLHYLVVSQ